MQLREVSSVGGRMGGKKKFKKPTKKPQKTEHQETRAKPTLEATKVLLNRHCLSLYHQNLNINDYIRSSRSYRRKVVLVNKHL